MNDDDGDPLLGCTASCLVVIVFWVLVFLVVYRVIFYAA